MKPLEVHTFSASRVYHGGLNSHVSPFIFKGLVIYIFYFSETFNMLRSPIKATPLGLQPDLHLLI